MRLAIDFKSEFPADSHTLLKVKSLNSFLKRELYHISWIPPCGRARYH
jgi:hypothetical protein